jgi:hypothetical protein
LYQPPPGHAGALEAVEAALWLAEARAEANKRILWAEVAYPRVCGEPTEERAGETRAKREGERRDAFAAGRRGRAGRLRDDRGAAGGRRWAVSEIEARVIPVAREQFAGRARHVNN